jgi:hypothetical protein
VGKDSPPVEDSDTQRLSQERASPETQEPWTSDLTDPNQDSVTSPSPVQQTEPEHGDDAAELRPVADIGEGAGPECDYRESTSGDLDADRASESGRQPRGCNTTLSPSLKPLSSTEPRAGQRKRKSSPRSLSKPGKRQRTSDAKRDNEQLLVKATHMIADIATFDGVVFVWERFALLRKSNSGQENLFKDPRQHNNLLQSPQRR